MEVFVDLWLWNDDQVVVVVVADAEEVEFERNVESSGISLIAAQDDGVVGSETVMVGLPAVGEVAEDILAVVVV